MPYAIDETHDPNLESWVESANDPETDFPIQNLPLCTIYNDRTETYQRADDEHRFVLGDLQGVGAVLIGDQVLDLMGADRAGLFDPSYYSDLLSDDDRVAMENQNPRGLATNWAWVESASSLRDAASQWQHDPFPETQSIGLLRKMVSRMLRRDGSELSKRAQDADILLPADKALFRNIITDRFVGVGNYTDFYASVYHATNVGSMFRPDNPLLPNYKWIPVGYHGRASSVVPSGTPIRRPSGQLSPAEEGGAPSFGPCKLLDYELELGVVMGRGNKLGETIPIGEAEDHILGVCLLNDWSARDMQKWEYVPLGPFLAKSFATSVSPYLVTMEALAPFRTPAMKRPAGDPKPLPHLFDEHDQAHGGIDITMEVLLASKQMRDKSMDPIRLSKGSFKDMYWTIAQMVTHHASNGCNMQPGDLLGSGTVSGPTRDARGCLLELTWDGDPFAKEPKRVPGTQRTPIALPTGETRIFLGDHDEVILKGYCQRDGYRRIGLGECRGVIEPSPG
ncbi:MAG: fumarylacetoacetase [Planctomycetota bacterium]